MIITARHHWFYYPFFKTYSLWMPRKDFRRVVLHSVPADKGLPLLMIGNHFSWWDGFIAHYINLKVFHRKFHIMMLEDQLRERMFLNKTGAYSIRKGGRSMLESFSYTGDLLSDPGNMVVMYPQGSIHSAYDQPIVFEKGWYRMLKPLAGSFQFIFYVALVDYYSHRKPTLNIYLYDYSPEGKDFSEVERDFNRCYRESVELQKSYL